MNDLVADLRAAGVGRGGLVGIAIAPGIGTGLAIGDADTRMVSAADVASEILAVDRELAPRWVSWSQETPAALVADGVRLGRAWDLAAVHRLLFGGWRADPGRAWARGHGLSADDLPTTRPTDLFHQPDPAADPPAVRPDGHLDADWIAGTWSHDVEHVAAWAGLARELAIRQHELLAALDDPARALATARSESTTELLCAELAADGLPFDRPAAERVIASFIGPRPRDSFEEAALRQERDDAVLRHVPPGAPVDLRSPGQVKSLLRRAGIEVPDTRAWRLEGMRQDHPLVDALLTWRRAERVATTYGYAWLDATVGSDGRLRGEWTGSDGAAGRMTASAGLHNMPAEMRPAVLAGRGRVFVRADLGQIEPRILAAVSGDDALAAATAEDDMYVPVARQLGVDRATAKVAVLGAMYGQTTGHGAQAMARLRVAYPVAIAYLEAAAEAAQGGQDLRTVGGRLVRMGVANANDHSERDLRSHAAARGRYGRNAMVQGAAAEFFKTWAVLVRARIQALVLDARVVLCLHDELLVHAPVSHATEMAALVDDCLQEAAARWMGAAGGAAPPVRFTADTTVIECWADAKD